MELLLLIPAITAFVAAKIARLRAARPESPSAEVTARLEALERELAETQERLDFAERLLTKLGKSGGLAARDNVTRPRGLTRA